MAEHQPVDGDRAVEEVADIHLTHVAAIPHHKVGQTLLFREDEILEWMAGNKVA